jgi:hypothetical protein
MFVFGSKKKKSQSYKKPPESGKRENGKKNLSLNSVQMHLESDITLGILCSALPEFAPFS